MGDPFVPTTDKSSTSGVGGINTGNISLSEFKQQENGTRVSTPAGTEFAPRDLSLPRITPDGVFVTAAQAEAIVAEAGKYATILVAKASELVADNDEQSQLSDGENPLTPNEDDDSSFDTGKNKKGK